MTKDTWSPEQYDKFKSERSQPFFDLMALLKLKENARVIDLGCGTGELTAELHKHTQSHSTIGIDSSEEMLNKAALLKRSGLSFKIGNIDEWREHQQYDIVFANAALQWCANHRELFTRLKESLRPNGQLAVQMPMNHDYPTHTLAADMGRDAYDQGAELLLPEEYATLLFHLGFREQKVFVRVYGHELESRESVIEWVKGTLLNRFKSRLSEENYSKFLQEYRERLFKILPDDKPFFYPFKRILIWGQL